MCNFILYMEVKWLLCMFKLFVMFIKRILICFLCYVVLSCDIFDGIVIYYDFSMNESIGKRYFVMILVGCLGFV